MGQILAHLLQPHVAHRLQAAGWRKVVHCLPDDASRFIVGHGVFAEATAKHAIDVLKGAIVKHGRPASILTDHGTRFYASAEACKRKGVAKFEQELVSMNIHHIPARVRHPQTNGKLERFHGELQRKLHLFEEESIDRTTRSNRSDDAHVGRPFSTEPKKDPVTRLVEWYSYDRPHMSLDLDSLETPARAFVREMPPPGQVVID